MPDTILPAIKNRSEVYDLNVRTAAEKEGVILVPSGFYYPVPSLEDIEASFEYKEAQPFANSDLFDQQHMLHEIESLTPYAAEFQAPAEDDPENPGGFFWKNGQFQYSDALSYYAIVRRDAPNRVLEIGSGFSTLVAVEAIERNGSGEVVCVEPYPRKFMRNLPVKLNETPVQELTAEWFNDSLSDGDILFIDSTHTVKTGSDCVHLYLRILPALRRTVKVHVHDIFLPAPFPKQWMRERHLYWAEQYLLMAYLLDNPRNDRF